MSGSAEPRSRVSGLRRPMTVLLGGLLVLTIPSRAKSELAGANLTRVSYGFFDWGIDADGTPARWSGPRATVFIDGRARLIEIPLSGGAPSSVLQQVEVRVDGRLANRVVVGAERQRLRTLLPASASTGARRIDLIVSPPWVPAEVIPGSEDRRVLGVKVGEIKVILAPSGDR